MTQTGTRRSGRWRAPCGPALSSRPAMPAPPARSSRPALSPAGAEPVPNRLRLSVHTCGRGLVVAEVSGEIDLMTAPDLVATLQAPQVSPPGSLVLLDLTGLGFCDVTGLNALVRSRRILGERGAWLALAAPPRSLLKLLAITGLDQLFEVFPQPARPQELPQPQARSVRVPRDASGTGVRTRRAGPAFGGRAPRQPPEVSHRREEDCR